MKVLLTGGAGFVGSHLFDALIVRGDVVSVVDDFKDYYDPAIKRRELPKGGFTLHERDLRQVSDVVRDEKPDVVVLLAARAGVRPSLQDPALYESVNVGGPVALLEACRSAGVKRFVFASSSPVYGDTQTLFVEDDLHLKPGSSMVL
jgi:UDP-glucuronate 4-epimerase